jgi:hypothetical protein
LQCPKLMFGVHRVIAVTLDLNKIYEKLADKLMQNFSILQNMMNHCAKERLNMGFTFVVSSFILFWPIATVAVTKQRQNGSECKREKEREKEREEDGGQFAGQAHLLFMVYKTTKKTPKKQE